MTKHGILYGPGSLVIIPRFDKRGNEGTQNVGICRFELDRAAQRFKSLLFVSQRDLELTERHAQRRVFRFNRDGFEERLIGLREIGDRTGGASLRKQVMKLGGSLRCLAGALQEPAGLVGLTIAQVLLAGTQACFECDGSRRISVGCECIKETCGVLASSCVFEPPAPRQDTSKIR